MELYFYRDRESFFHRLDGLTKIARLCGNCGLGVLQTEPWRLAAVVALILLQCGVARSLPNLARIWRFLAIVTVVTTCLWTAVGAGTIPLLLWMTQEGLLSGISAALRIDAFILAGTVFLSTTRNEEVLQALVRLRVPYPICFAFSTALRLAPTFVGMGFAVKEAQKARGLDPDAGSPLDRLRKNIPLLIPAFLSTIRMTGQLAMSLESKGFGLKRERTFLLESCPGWRDGLAVAALAMALCVSWAMR